MSAPRVIGFGLAGSVLAVVMQLPYEGKLAYIQALVLGMTWPTFVAAQAQGKPDTQQLEKLADQIKW